jgi:hypothetical protein
MTQCPPHVACDGRSIALDDIKELETMQRKKEIWQELFRNAARIKNNARSNAWLRPIVHKYNTTCREILDQQKQVLHHFITLSNYCSNENDLKPIREELEHIHAQMKELEYIPSDDDTDDDKDDTDDDKDDTDDDKDDTDDDKDDTDDDKDDTDDDKDDTDDDKDDTDDDKDDTDDDSSSSSMDLEDFL